MPRVPRTQPCHQRVVDDLLVGLRQFVPGTGGGPAAGELQGIEKVPVGAVEDRLRTGHRIGTTFHAEASHRCQHRARTGGRKGGEQRGQPGSHRHTFGARRRLQTTHRRFERTLGAATVASGHCLLQL